MLYLGQQNQAIFARHTTDFYQASLSADKIGRFCRQIKSADFVVRLTSPLLVLTFTCSLMGWKAVALNAHIPSISIQVILEHVDRCSINDIEITIRCVTRMSIVVLFLRYRLTYRLLVFQCKMLIIM